MKRAAKPAPRPTRPSPHQAANDAPPEPSPRPRPPVMRKPPAMEIAIGGQTWYDVDTIRWETNAEMVVIIGHDRAGNKVTVAIETAALVKAFADRGGK